MRRIRRSKTEVGDFDVEFNALRMTSRLRLDKLNFNVLSLTQVGQRGLRKLNTHRGIVPVTRIVGEF